MRKLLIVGALACVTLMPVGARATDASGTVLIPTGSAVSDGNARPARCAYDLDPINGQGIFGWVLTEVTPGTVFVLDGSGTLADVDIDFFHALGGCADDPSKTAEEHDNRTGDEKGVVPEGATAAVVTLRTGANISFTYTEEVVPG
jgi:hypothetical protein